MKIIKLTAENVKRLRAVEITPDGTVQVVTGRNAQGKTSVLDAIWLALGGSAASRATKRPIRDGAKQASVRLDLGDLVVNRTWSGDKTTLTVLAADGARYSSPQAVLDRLVGRLSFDPLEFTRLSPREQVTTLLDSVLSLEVDLDQLAADRQRIYDDRTEVGRQRKIFEGQAAGAGAMEKAPEREVSVQELVSQYQSAAAEKADYDRLLSRISVRQDSIKQLREDLAEAETDLAVLIGERDATQDGPDLGALQEEIANAEETNRAVRRNEQRAAVAKAVGDVRVQWDDLTAQIEAIDTARTEALAKAEFPVPGLGFDDDGVTYNGIPFGQASSSEQIRVSLAMAMALNPELRVIRILDGSLLDEDNLELIAQQAALEDYQVWIERVSDGSGVGVVIEDGAVAPEPVTLDGLADAGIHSPTEATSPEGRF